MIEQRPVQAGDQTAPASIQDIRGRITRAVDATQGSALDRLKIWLQMPSEPGFTDPTCLIRAADVGARLSSTGQQSYEPPSLASAIGLQGRWKAIDAQLQAGTAVKVKGSTGHVGGSRSRFLDVKDNTGFHVIVFLAKGTAADARGFYLGFDPDVTATDETRAKWAELIPANTSFQNINDPVRSVEIIKAMIVGDVQTGFGPLVRKYYIDTSVAFPPIKISKPEDFDV
jgi:hypothetical protein